MDFSASDFLPILSNPPKDKVEELYFGTIPSLDLSSCIPADGNLIRKEKVSPFLDVVSKTDPPPFFEEDYLDFLTNKLNDFLYSYEHCLFFELGKISNHARWKDSGFLERLWKMKPSSCSTAILHRYILAYKKIKGYVCVEQSSSFFHDVSSILFAKNYEDSSLSFRLLQAVSFNYHISFDVLLNTRPVEKTDYILEHLKAFCKENDCLEKFHLFKLKNSTLPCLSSGRKDLLEVLFKYGSWRVFSNDDIYDWMFKCFGVRYRHGEHCIFSLLRELQFNPRRYFLVLQMYYVLQVAREKCKRRFLSTLLLLWRILADPFLCWYEMYHVLIKTVPVENHTHVDSFCSVYKIELCHGNLKPRSLKHISRCKIRTLLDVKGCLPEGICCLNIPENCKSYLRLEY